ncbi:MAG TPA: hypothetical protein ENJ89_00190, partial [Caldithrix abyssi]|nr:hypothetical protein [Caldithrix abyssi]
MFKIRQVILILLLFVLPIMGQKFSSSERLQGFAQRGDTTIFLFDADLYRVRPNKVVVEGAMRGWNHDMSDARWWLKPVNKDKTLWTLPVLNPNSEKPSPGTAFKFRVDAGKWMQPPDSAPNTSGGNLILLPEQKPLRVKALLVGARDIRLLFPDKTPTSYRYEAEAYRIWSPAGVEIPVERVLYSGRGELQLVPAEKLDIKRWYRVQTPYRKQKLVTRYDGWFAHRYSDKSLGARFFSAKNVTTIRLFAPRADSVFVFLYRQPFGKPV